MKWSAPASQRSPQIPKLGPELEARQIYDKGVRAIAWRHRLQEQWLRNSLSWQADDALNDPGVTVGEKRAVLRDAGQFLLKPESGDQAHAVTDREVLELCIEAARFYLVRGGFKAARRFAAKAEGMAHHDADFATWASARHELGLALNGAGMHDEALALFRELVSLRTAKLGEKEPDTLRSRTGLAQALAGKHQFAEAEQEDRAMLEVQQQVLGSEHPEALSTRTDLAMAMEAQCKHIAGEQDLRSVLAIQQRMLGAEHLDTLRTRYCLALCLYHQHLPAEALKFDQQALTGYRHTLGNLHPRTRHANDLGRLLSAPEMAP